MIRKILQFLLATTLLSIIVTSSVLPRVNANSYYDDQNKIVRVENNQDTSNHESDNVSKENVLIQENSKFNSAFDEFNQTFISQIEHVVQKSELICDSNDTTQEIVEDETLKQEEQSKDQTQTDSSIDAEHSSNDLNEEGSRKEKTEQYNYTTVDEYLYVNTSLLNIRTGPGTEHKKVGSFVINDKVHRIEILDNGWSKISYDDQELYVYSSYLSKEEVHVETVLEEMNRRGNIGRLRITSVGIDVAIFATSIYDLSHSQPIVDRSDSAAYMEDGCNYYGFILIGDHVHQGFGGIKKSVIGSTIMEIDNGSTIKKYICVDRFIGYNGYKGVGGLYDANGNSVAGRNDGGICLYTCNSDGSITITFWQPT